MPSDPQGKSRPPMLRVVGVSRATRIFRRLLRLIFNGLLGCLSNRHPEVADFDGLEVTTDEYVYEEYEDGKLVRTTQHHKRKFTLSAAIIGTIVSIVAYYFLK